MKFSIIIATLNNQDTLEKNLKSIKDQNYKDYEIIVIDGDSKDKTIEINFQKKETERKIQIVELEKNNVINELKFSLKEANNLKQLAVTEAVKNIEKERDNLSHKLNNAELHRIKSESNLKDK